MENYRISDSGERIKQEFSDLQDSDPLYAELREKVQKNRPARMRWGDPWLAGYEAAVWALENEDKNTADGSGRHLENLKNVEEYAGHIKKLFVDLASEFEFLSEYTPEDQRTKFIRKKLNEMFAGEDNRIYFGDAIENLKPLEISARIKEGYLSLDSQVKALRRHAEIFENESKKLQQLLFETRKEYLERIKEGIRDGWLPDSLAAAEARTKFAKIEFVDKLTDPRPILGDHRPDGTIGVYSDQLDDANIDGLRHTITHELLHETSAKALIFIKEQSLEKSIFFDSSDAATYAVDTNISGVSRSAERGKDRKYIWLNEAITEWLALKLTSYSNGKTAGETSYRGSDSYTQERRELDRLFAAGLGEHEVIEAYLEDAQGVMPTGNNDKFSRLVQRINEIESDPCAFDRLENKFKFSQIKKNLPFFLKTRDEIFEYEKKSPRGSLIYTVESVYGHGDSAYKEEFFFRILPVSSYDSKTQEQQFAEFVKQIEKFVARDPSMVRFVVNQPKHI